MGALLTIISGVNRTACRVITMSDNVALSDVLHLYIGIAIVARISAPDTPQKGPAGVVFRVH